MSDENDIEAEDGFGRGFHGVPNQSELDSMTFLELSEKFVLSQRDSVPFHIFDREIKRRHSQDQAEVNRANIGYGAIIAGVFTVIGTVIGVLLTVLIKG